MNRPHLASIVCVVLFLTGTTILQAATGKDSGDTNTVVSLDGVIGSNDGTMEVPSLGGVITLHWLTIEVTSPKEKKPVVYQIAGKTKEIESRLKKLTGKTVKIKGTTGKASFSGCKSKVTVTEVKILTDPVPSKILGKAVSHAVEEDKAPRNWRTLAFMPGESFSGVMNMPAGVAVSITPKKDEIVLCPGKPGADSPRVAFQIRRLDKRILVASPWDVFD